MPNKLSQREFLKRLKQRNKCLTEEKSVFLCPPSTQYHNQREHILFECRKGHIWNGNFNNTIILKRGCPKCKKHSERMNKRIPFEQIIEQSRFVHGDKYSYDKTTYTNSHGFMEVFCNIHDIYFNVTPMNHIHQKQQCPECNRDILKETFIKKATKVHTGKYDYSGIRYKNSNIKIGIGCPHHGIFNQKPNDHLHGHGCPKCVMSTISKKQISWLEYIQQQLGGIFIQHAGNIGEYHIPETQYRTDGYCKETNTVYEFHGDVFHGNPVLYTKDEKCHPFNKEMTAGQLYEKTIEREKIILDLGYNLEVLWESEFNALDIPILNIDYSNIVHRNHNIPTEELDILRIQFGGGVFTGYKTKQTFLCLLCNTHFVTTLSQRKQAFKKYKSVGCPTCSRKKDF